MPIKVSVFVATSLDGFIARKDGSIDWLDKANAGIPHGEDGGFRQFMNSVDLLAMGRKTFEQVLSFNSWPYGEKPVVVLSSKQLHIPSPLQNHVSVSCESPTELLKRLAREGIRHVYIDGGYTISSFLKENLVDEITITVVPVVLGEGNPLFGPGIKDLWLDSIETKAFNFGFVQLKYRVRK